MTYSEMIASIIEVLESEDLSESSKEKLTEVIKQLAYQWNDSLSIFF